MGRMFSLVAVLIVMAIGAYIYTQQARNATVEGAASPAGTIDFVGIRHDLMAIAQAERVHSSLHSGYASLEDLRSSGDLTMERTNRGPYNYSVDFDGSGFRAVATYSGPETKGVTKSISIDQTMRFTEE